MCFVKVELSAICFLNFRDHLIQMNDFENRVPPKPEPGESMKSLNKTKTAFFSFWVCLSNLKEHHSRTFPQIGQDFVSV